MNTRPLVLACAVSSLLLSSVADARIPPRPSMLRADVYSLTTAELFWNRSDTAVAYEVRRDGVVVATIDGLSWFAEGLSPDADTRWEVVAIDADGDRSPVAQLTVSTGPSDTGATASTGTPTAPTAGPAPAAPADLRIQRYSATTAELFWARAPGAALTYAVTRDGTSLGTTGGTSFFVDGLTPGAEQRFTVVAFAGKARGAQSSVTLDGKDGKDGTGATGSPPDAAVPGKPANGAGAPPAPINARLDVYSSSTAELLWQRVPGSAAARVEIVRDGTVLGVTDGNSFLDGGRAGGVSYTYELIAIGGDGSRSAATRVGGGATAAPVTGGGSNPDTNAGTDIGDGPVLTADNLARQLPRVLATLNALGQERAEAAGYAFLEVAGGTRAPESLGLTPLGGSATRFSCAFGGTVDLSSNDGTDGATFGGCATTIEGGARATLDGNLTRTPRPQALVDGAGGETVTGRTFTVATADGARTFDGSSSFRGTGGGVLPKRGVVGAYAFRAADGGRFTDIDSISFTIANLAEERANGTRVTRWDTSARFSADWTNGRTLTASTLQGLTNRGGDGRTFTDGALRISETKDRSVTIFADTGDAATFRAVVLADGQRTESVLRWSDALGLRCAITASGEFVAGSARARAPYACD